MDASTKFSLAVAVLGVVISLYITRQLEIRNPDAEWISFGVGALCFAISEFLVSVFFWFFILAIVPFVLWIIFTRLWPAILQIIVSVTDGIETFSTEAGISVRDAKLGPQRVEATEQLRERLVKLDRQIEDIRQVEGVEESDKDHFIAQLQEQRRFVQRTLQTLIQGGSTPR